MTESKADAKTATAATKADDKTGSNPVGAEAGTNTPSKPADALDARNADSDPSHYARLSEEPQAGLGDLVTMVGYSEDENHRPDPMFQYGTVDTSDTSGGAQSRIQEVSPVFDVARAQNLETAARALDPKDPTPSELVVLPAEANTAEIATDRLHAAVAELKDNPVEIGGLTREQKLAAEGEGPTADETTDKAEAK